MRARTVEPVSFQFQGDDGARLAAGHASGRAGARCLVIARLRGVRWVIAGAQVAVSEREQWAALHAAAHSGRAHIVQVT